ncbi:YjbF family lipoprotein [Rhodobacteraceae bacterium]|nr:YjbF family lipoprotein [Paracoccaceae bacterium]
MKWIFVVSLAFTTLISCSNSSDFETGEIKAIKMLRETLIAHKKSTILLDTRKIITRNKIDNAKIPVLFVELENGQNGTLTLYPGEGIGETWLGADGATITLQSGRIKATRGMRSDVMGSTSSMPPWSEIEDTSEYSRQISYLGGDNQTSFKTFSCIMKKHNKQSTITIFDVPFETQEFLEVCINGTEKLENIYFVDYKNVVRSSKQYHGAALGYLTIERLDR